MAAMKAKDEPEVEEKKEEDEEKKQPEAPKLDVEELGEQKEAEEEA